MRFTESSWRSHRAHHVIDTAAVAFYLLVLAAGLLLFWPVTTWELALYCAFIGLAAVLLVVEVRVLLACRAPHAGVDPWPYVRGVLAHADRERRYLTAAEQLNLFAAVHAQRGTHPAEREEHPRG